MDTHVLIVDDEPKILSMMKGLLDYWDYHTLTASSGTEAIGIVKKQQPDIVLLDVRLPDMNGKSVLRRILDIAPDTIVIMVTAYTSTDDAFGTAKDGAFGYLDKVPRKGKFNDQLLELLKKAEARVRKLRACNDPAFLRASFLDEAWSQGDSPAMHDLWSKVDKAAALDWNVTIVGQGFVGKEYVARRIHQQSRRKTKPFVAVDCSMFCTSRDENAAFGFHGTGRRPKGGFFSAVRGGTLFLDEVSFLPQHIQSRLRSEVHPARNQVNSDPSEEQVRVVAATSVGLTDLAAEGKLDKDLAYILGQFVIGLPPLSERKDDIPHIATYLCKRTTKKLGYSIKEITPSAMNVLQEYTWPGEVLELMNVLEGAILNASKERITKECIKFDHPHSSDYVINGGTGSMPYVKRMEELDRQIIKAALEEAGGSTRKAAKLLDLPPSTLHRKKKRYDI